MSAEPVGLAMVGQLVPALGLIVVGLLAVRWWLQRARPAGPRPALRVVARTGVTKGAVVAVVTVGAHRLLVGASDHGVTLLTELDASPDPATDPTALPNPMLHDAATEMTTPGLPLQTTGPAYPDGRPWMGPFRRLQQMTVRQATPHTHPRRPFGELRP